MFASILQLTGAIVLGYFIAFRTKVKSRQAARMIVPVKGKRNMGYLDRYTETYAYRIGFSFIIVGYLVQIANFNVQYLQDMDVFCKLVTAILSTIILTYLSALVAGWFGRRLFEKEGVYDPNEDVREGEFMIELDDD
ncbi:hypothetical protein SAMN05421743_101233 [Thalassobacillus cyri]|uniref:Uncharacterized protein n=1 Tax=Thalassobacillus cyri TaxID=571932 RepID=A0A1H3VXS9_9BACI|nr:hypothetical protein [Thalassobacillus cyri]SDZ79606.1 hypothetical protein SAMN05421743_101233 [Thalassobacillus cyri]